MGTVVIAILPSVRRLAALLFPGCVLILAGLVLLRPGVLPDAWRPYVHGFPYLVGGVGLLLGCYFHRSRIVFALVLLAAVEVTLRGIGDQHATPGSVGRFVYAALAVLLPVNLVVCAVRKERGLFSSHGQTRFGMIAIQVIAVGALIRLEWAPATEWLEAAYLGGRLAGRTELPEAAVATFVVAIALLAGRCGLRRDPIEAGCLWAVVSGGIALHGLRWGWTATPLLGTAGLTLIWALLATTYRMAYTDELTDLPGRRALDEALLRVGSRYTVAMVDVDHFKRFNDLFGHEVGDQALRMVATKLSRVQGGGKAFRYGGEEFALLFAGGSLDEATPHLEAVRQVIAGSRFVVRGSGRPRKKPTTPRVPHGPHVVVSLTVSIGAAEREGRTGLTDPHDVLRAADKALYRAKRAGRNRLVA